MRMINMSQVLYYTAGSIAAFLLIYHMIAGRKEVVLPMRSTPGLDPVVRDTLHLGWHCVTVTVALLSTLFLVAALTLRHDFAIAGTMLAWGFAILGIGLVRTIGASYRDLPQGWLFLPIAALGTAGLLL